MQAEEGPNYDAACFHAHQCTEKYLKARLVEGGVHFPRIHDLEALLELVLPLEPGWEGIREALISLNGMDVEVRYPGYFSDADEAKQAVEFAEKVRAMVRSSLELEG